MYLELLLLLKYIAGKKTMHDSDTHLCETCQYVIRIIYINTSVVICSKIHLRSQYFRYTEVLILKVYHKKVLLILPNPSVCYIAIIL